MLSSSYITRAFHNWAASSSVEPLCVFYGVAQLQVWPEKAHTNTEKTCFYFYLFNIFIYWQPLQAVHKQNVIYLL